MHTTEIGCATRRLEDLARSAPTQTVDAPGSSATSVLDRTPLIDGLLAVLIDALADDLFATPSSTTEPSRFEALMRMLNKPEMQAALRQDHPLGPAWIRGMRTRQSLLQAEGGVCSEAEMAKLLGTTHQDVDERRRSGTLIAVHLGTRGYFYPAWQVGVRGLDVALLAMPDVGPWSQWAYMLSPNRYLDNMTPADALRAGNQDGVVMAIMEMGNQIAW